MDDYLPARPPLEAEQVAVPLPRHIRFRHPAYPLTHPPLLSLLAVDGDHVEDGFGTGIDYWTAIIACGIVADNRFHGTWFGRRNQTDDEVNFSVTRCDEPLDGVLRGDEYFFYIDTDDKNPTKYPVVPSFDHWRFPHENIPELWVDLGRRLSSATSGIPSNINIAWNAKVMARDESCRISGCYEGCETAHLVPRDKENWHVINDMSRYGGRVTTALTVDDAYNAILLRSDLHHHFDLRRLALAPKRGKTAEQNSETGSHPSSVAPHLVVHQVRETVTRELHTLYHNRSIQAYSSGISYQFLFARFAWTIFCDEVYTFFRGPLQSRVLVRDAETFRGTIQQMDGKRVAGISILFNAPNKSRSVSPRKRKQNASDDYNCAPSRLRSESISDDEGDEFKSSIKSYTENEDDYFAPPRGRSRASKLLNSYPMHSNSDEEESRSTVSITSLETLVAQESTTVLLLKECTENDEDTSKEERDRNGLGKHPSRKRRRLSLSRSHEEVM